MDAKKILTILAFAFVGWAACGATMGIGMAVTTIETTLMPWMQMQIQYPMVVMSVQALTML